MIKQQLNLDLTGCQCPRHRLTPSRISSEVFMGISSPL